MVCVWGKAVEAILLPVRTGWRRNVMRKERNLDGDFAREKGLQARRAG